MILEPSQLTGVTHDPGGCLANLDDACFEAIRNAAFRRTYKKGQIICHEGDPCPGLMMIETGWIKAVKSSPQGREQETRLAGPGEMINEISVMAGGDNLVTLKSLEASSLWVIGRAELFDLMAQYPALSSTINQSLAKQTVLLLNLVEDLSLRAVDSRLARLLLNRSLGDIILRQNWYTEAEMAACIGTTSEIISRILNEMEAQGAIRLERHKISILDRKMLEGPVYQKYK